MPASPTADESATKAAVKDTEDEVNVEELTEEMKEAGESDPEVSHCSGRATRHVSNGERMVWVYAQVQCNLGQCWLVERKRYPLLFDPTVCVVM